MMMYRLSVRVDGSGTELLIESEQFGPIDQALRDLRRALATLTVERIVDRQGAGRPFDCVIVNDVSATYRVVGP